MSGSAKNFKTHANASTKNHVTVHVILKQFNDLMYKEFISPNISGKIISIKISIIPYESYGMIHVYFSLKPILVVLSDQWAPYRATRLGTFKIHIGCELQFEKH